MEIKNDNIGMEIKNDNIGMDTLSLFNLPNELISTILNQSDDNINLFISYYWST